MIPIITSIIAILSLAWAALCQRNLTRYKSAVSALFEKREQIEDNFPGLDPEMSLPLSFEKEEVWIPYQKKVFDDTYKNRKYTLIFAYKNRFSIPPDDIDLKFMFECAYIDENGEIQVQALWADDIKRLEHYNSKIKNSSEL